MRDNCIAVIKHHHWGSLWKRVCNWLRVPVDEGPWWCAGAVGSRRGCWAEAESTCPEMQNTKAESGLGMVWVLKPQSLPAVTHFLKEGHASWVCPTCTTWGPRIQMPKSIGGIYHSNHYSLTDIIYIKMIRKVWSLESNKVWVIFNLCAY